MVSQIFDSLVPAATVVLIVRLWRSGLYHRYRAFFCYLIFTLLQAILPATLDLRSPIYQKAYMVTEPIQWVFYVWVVMEIYRLVLEDYRGLSTVGRWIMIVAVGVGVVVSAVSLAVPSQSWQTRLMAYYNITDRAIYLSLVVFLFTMLFLLLQYPIHLSRNTVVHAVVFFLYFLSNTVMFLIFTTRGTRHLWVYLRYAVPAVTLGALVSWIVLLTPAGEKYKVTLRPKWMPGEEEALVGQLTYLNAALLRAGAKINR
jgi:hypothetical protein